MKITSATSLPVLCEFWQEDDVWNGEAKDLPIAIFGDTFEEAQAHMRDAIQGYMESSIEAGDMPDVVAILEKAARHRITPEELSPKRPVLKISVELTDKNQKLVSVA
jgi:hypothetical protein